MLYTYFYDSPLCPLRLTSDGNFLTGVWFDTLDAMTAHQKNTIVDKPLPIFQQTIDWFDIYFTGENPDFTPPLQMNTTPFRKMVWEIMCTIPYGSTITYGDIAKQVADIRNVERMSAQAVGGAVGHNAISIIIPCHRVIGSNGNLTGYGGGLDKKVKLLTLEGVDISPFYLPNKN